MQFEFPSFDLDHTPTIDPDMDADDVADQRQLLQATGLSVGLLGVRAWVSVRIRLNFKGSCRGGSVRLFWGFEGSGRL